ncbi:MAG: hypothetical protein R3C16_11725 [Hyphomonadaceae bacterium]
MRAYAAFGVHRSGSTGDHETAQWLQQRLRRAGYDVRRDDIAINTVLEPWADVRAGAIETRAFVQLFAPEAAWGSTIEAPLVRAGQGAALSGAIAVVPEPAPATAYWPADHDGPVHALAAAGARAAILNVAAPNGDIYALNRDIHAPRFPIPVLLVGADTHTQLLQASGSSASIAMGGPLVPEQTHVISARKSGQGRGIVISTPLTGWFTCGAERGAGVALLLALGEALRDVDAPVLLLGTGGHEIGHIGMHEATVSAPSPDEVALWVHLGSSIASLAAPGSSERNPAQYTFVSAAMTPLAQRLLGPVAPQVVEVGADGPGETGQVIGRLCAHHRLCGRASRFPYAAGRRVAVRSRLARTNRRPYAGRARGARSMMQRLWPLAVLLIAMAACACTARGADAQRAACA